MIIVGLGEILWDVFPDKKILGGAPANFAYHVSQLGHDGYAVSAIGNDSLGQEITENLEHKKLKHILDVTSYPTGTVQVKLDNLGVPTYEICENVAWDNIPFSSKTEALAKQADAVCFGSLAQRSPVSQASIRKFIEAMPTNSIKVFDINFRQNFYTKGVIHESLKLANIMKINDEEVLKIAELFEWMGSEQEICTKIQDEYNLRMLILTKGAEGSYIFTAETSSFLKTPKVNVVDTVGAGDAFTAGFLSAYLDGASIEVAHQFAVNISAYVCTQQGAMPQLPSTLIHSKKG